MSNNKKKHNKPSQQTKTPQPQIKIPSPVVPIYRDPKPQLVKIEAIVDPTDFMYFNGVFWDSTGTDDNGRKIYTRRGEYKDKLIEDQNGRIEMPGGKKYTLKRRGENK